MGIAIHRQTANKYYQLLFTVQLSYFITQYKDICKSTLKSITDLYPKKPRKPSSNSKPKIFHCLSSSNGESKCLKKVLINNDIYPDQCIFRDDSKEDIIKQHNCNNEDEVKNLGIDICNNNEVVQYRQNIVVLLFNVVYTSAILSTKCKCPRKATKVEAKDDMAYIKEDESSIIVFDYSEAKANKVIHNNNINIVNKSCFSNIVILHKPRIHHCNKNNKGRKIRVKKIKNGTFYYIFDMSPRLKTGKNRINQMIITYVKKPANPKKKIRKKDSSTSDTSKDNSAVPVCGTDPEPTIENGTYTENIDKREMKNDFDGLVTRRIYLLKLLHNLNRD